LQQLRNKVGNNGVYAANIGTNFHALDFSGSLRTGQADNLARAAAAGGNHDLATITSSFVSSTDSAIIADGRVKPKAKSNDSGGGAGGVLIGVAVLALAGGGAFLAVNSRKKKRQKAKRDA